MCGKSTYHDSALASVIAAKMTALHALGFFSAIIKLKKREPDCTSWYFMLKCMMPRNILHNTQKPPYPVCLSHILAAVACRD